MVQILQKWKTQQGQRGRGEALVGSSLFMSRVMFYALKEKDEGFITLKVGQPSNGQRSDLKSQRTGVNIPLVPLGARCHPPIGH